MFRRDFIKYVLGSLSVFYLTGNFNDDGIDYYYDREDLNICLGEYVSHEIQYNLDEPENFYLGDSIYCRYVSFPREFKLKITYSLFTMNLIGFNINLDDIQEILLKKPKDLVTKKNKLIINCKNKDYIFLVHIIESNKDV